MKTLILLILSISLGLRLQGISSPLFISQPVQGNVEAQAYEPTPIPTQSLGTVKASWYGVKEYCERFNPSCIMANGVKLEDDMFIAACSSNYKLGDLLGIKYKGKTIIVECTDRGSFEQKYGRQLDLSKAAFSALAPLSKGVIEVEVL